MPRPQYCPQHRLAALVPIERPLQVHDADFKTLMSLVSQVRELREAEELIRTAALWSQAALHQVLFCPSCEPHAHDQGNAFADNDDQLDAPVVDSLGAVPFLVQDYQL